jgi:DNA replication initiation complex subunit (GINS family)
MITYNDIYEASRKERYSEQLQKLPKSFIADVAEYLSDKKQITLKDEGDFSDVITKTKKQLENAITLFRELVLRRRKKILNLILIAAETGISRQDFDNMLDFEKELFENMMKCVDCSEKKITESMEGKSKEHNNELVVFIEDVQQLMGLNGESMSFLKGDIANIPKEIAKILVDDGKAEVISRD